MEMESALYQLMGVRMNDAMNGITNSDGQYQEIIHQSDKYSGRLEELDLPEEVRLLIDRYTSEQNALGNTVLKHIHSWRCLSRPAIVQAGI
ncbi:MAG: hypothetical protein K2N44_01765 [Lachnospiraceae bacterium]|nr:hypothetical protein [Lachnospiraceae bacterium]